MIEKLGSKYETYCDPRLNYAQSIRFAQLLAKGFALANKHMPHNGGANGEGADVNPLCSLQ